MAKNRTRAAAALPNVSDGKSLFSGATGRWATTMLKKAALEGKALSAAALRTLDSLRHEEWKYFDDALVAEATIRLRGVADLIAAGLVKNVPNALGKTVFGYEKVTDMDPATTSLDGISRTSNDRQEFQLNQIPLPITHKDFFINLRVLAASREKGESLDTTQVRTAGRVVAEQLEKMLFQGGPQFGGLPIYGYMTEPNRNQSGFGTNGDWGQSAKTGADILGDLLTMMLALQADRMYGPYWLYVPTDAGVKLENDFKANVSQTIRQRLESVDGIAGVRVADQLPSSNVILVQATSDVTSWVQGEQLQTVQWDEYGGFELNFKAFAIGVPLVRSDAAGRSGVYHMFD
jgi:uncharacterized linocin/CFP29 family protein